MNFNIVAPRGQAFLLKRGTIADYEAKFVEFLAESAGVFAELDTLEFLRAITEFTSGTWGSKYSSGDIGRYVDDLRRYLSEGLGLEFNDEDFEYWRSRNS